MLLEIKPRHPLKIKEYLKMNLAVFERMSTLAIFFCG
jgi:hypothetical protein